MRSGVRPLAIVAGGTGEHKDVVDQGPIVECAHADQLQVVGDNGGLVIHKMECVILLE